MKKILYIGGFEMPDKNAAAQRVIANAMTLREMGYDVTFIGPTKDRSNIVSEFNGFKCDYIDYPQNLKQWIKYITTFVSSHKILAYNPDYVILYNFPAIASLKILKASHKRGIKVFHDLTEWEVTTGWLPREMIRKIDINLRMRYCMKKMDGVIAISRFLYENYKKSTNAILVPPTVDLTDKKWNRERRISTGEKIKLIYAGNAGFGVKDRLDVIVNSVAKFPIFQLDVIGMTEEQYILGYGLLGETSNIKFHGRVSHTEAIQAVQHADFQFLIREGNLKNNAGFPTKFVESFACCTPVIATLTSNIGDYLQNGKNGFVVDASHSLDSVLVAISKLTEKEIIKLKENCRDCHSFDYREYRSTFKQIFK